MGPVSDTVSEAKRLVLELIADVGMTQAEIATYIGRSPDMIYNVRKGKRPGDNLVPALTELRMTGRVEHVPPRRRRSDGGLARVRGPVQDWTPEPTEEGSKPVPRPTVVPQDVTAPEQAKARRNRFRVERQVYPGNVRRTDIHSPKKPTSKGRQEAERVMDEEVRRAARSQGAKNRVNPETGQVRGATKAKFWVTYEDGRRIELGGKSGYYISTQKKVRDQHGNVRDFIGLRQQAKQSGGYYAWLDSEVSSSVANRGSAGEVAGKRIVNVEMTTFYHSDEEQAKETHRRRSIHE